MPENDDLIYKTMRMGPIPTKPSRMAKVCLVLGILCIAPCLAPLLAIPAFITGIIALRRIGKGGEHGKESAMAGMGAAAFGLALVLALLLWPPGINERVMRISCMSNLKSIGLCLQQYAKDNNGQLPPYDGARGLETIRANGYLTDYKIYICPTPCKGIAAGKGTMPLEERNISYVYRGGLNESMSPDEPVMWDKPDNHRNYGNVLFLDGHVGQFKGADWLEHAKPAGKQTQGK